MYSALLGLSNERECWKKKKNMPYPKKRVVLAVVIIKENKETNKRIKTFWES